MSEEEFILAGMAILFGTTFAGFVFARITKLIRIWIETRAPGNKAQSDNQDFLKFKSEVERRLVAIETIITDDHEPLLKKSSNDLSPEEEIRQLSNLLKNKA